jgi:hypothetical protein
MGRVTYSHLSDIKCEVKMIQTSYFAKMNKMTDEEKGRCYSIVSSPPILLKIPNIHELAPSHTMLLTYKKNKDKFRYTELYLAKLYTRGFREVMGIIPDNAILLCYEKSGDFCHRHILAAWLKKYGVEVTEYIDK